MRKIMEEGVTGLFFFFFLVFLLKEIHKLGKSFYFCVYVFICLFNTDLLSSYYVPGTMLDA